MADIIRAQRNKSLSSAGGCDELNLEVVRVMDLDNRAQIAEAKASLRHITFEYNGIEKVKHNSPRKGGPMDLAFPARIIVANFRGLKAGVVPV